MTKSKIPKDIEAKVIFKSDRTCCVCHQKGKKWQINHINGDPNDNREENLCILCLDCHAEFHSKSAISKGLTPETLKYYKKHWEFVVLKKRQKEAGIIPKKLNLSKEQFLFEIEKTTLEIITLKDNDPRIKEKLDYLWEINLLKGYTREILDNLNVIGIQSFDSPRKESLVAETVRSLFYYLVGPSDVPWSPRYTLEVKKGIDVLTTIGEFSAEFTRQEKPLIVVCNNLLEIFESIILYNKQELGCKILKSFFKINNACIQKDENGKKFTKGMRIINKTIKKLIKIVKNNKLKWNRFYNLLKNKFNL
jgi:hypothetical protein